MFKILSAATAALSLFVGAASAATLSGEFGVSVVNATGLNSAQSQATFANFTTQVLGAAPGSIDTFNYVGELNFGTFDTANDATTIAQWLDTGVGGTVSDLDPTVGGLQQSAPNINNGTATTTFYLFNMVDDLLPGDFTITHDDGIAVFENGTLLGANVGPTSQTVTNVNGYNGGFLQFLYVATNGDPSVLNVDFEAAPVPLPAGMPLLLAGLGGLAYMRRRKQNI